MVYEVKEKLEFEREEIEDEIGVFDIVGENEDKGTVIIKAEDAIMYDVKISKLSYNLLIKERGYDGW